MVPELRYCQLDTQVSTYGQALTRRDVPITTDAFSLRVPLQLIACKTRVPEYFRPTR